MTAAEWIVTGALAAALVALIARAIRGSGERAGE